MEFIAKIVDLVNTFLWDYALLVLLLGAGIIFTFRLKFIQVRKFGEGMRSLFGNFSLHGGKSEEGRRSVPVILPELLPLLHPVDPVPFSGCGSARFSVWLRFTLKQLWLSTPAK